MKKQALIMAGITFLGGALAGMLGSSIRGAKANVPPANNRLFYSGVLQNATGPSMKNIQVKFFNAKLGGTQLNCTAPSKNIDVGGSAGRFQIDVSACATELDATADAFVEVVIDGQPFPPTGNERPRVGAVPYASQALSAQTAAQAIAAKPGSPLDHLANPHICGLTPLTNAQLAPSDGYHAAALKCRQVATCSATNATICNSADVVRFLGNQGAAQLPTSTADSAWIATGTFGQARGGGAANIFDDDCANFTKTSSTTDVGMRVSLSNATVPGVIDDADCGSQLPILCCDY